MGDYPGLFDGPNVNMRVLIWDTVEVGKLKKR